MKPLAITSREDGLGVREIEISGEVDLAVADQMQAALDDAIDDGVELLVVLRECEFIDSTGIALLVRARQKLADRNGRLLLCEPVGQVREVLTISGLLEPSFVVDSLEEARSSSNPR
ncbi:MAG TPA: STAS domain-containing protein [Solirubrobacterales bacterium]|nr:STAS domain-containing protein [Solirubrobacterales bacterium]